MEHMLGNFNLVVFKVILGLVSVCESNLVFVQVLYLPLSSRGAPGSMDLLCKLVSGRGVAG